MTFNFSKLVVHPRRAEQLNPDSRPGYFVAVRRRETLLNKCFFALGYSHRALYREIFGIDTEHQPFYAPNGDVYFDQCAAHIEIKRALQQSQRNRRYFQTVARRCEVLGERLYALSRRIKRADFSKKPDSAIRAQTQALFDSMTSLSAFLAFPISIQKYLEETLRRELAARVSQPRLAEKYFQTLTTPLKPSLGYQEQIAILKLAKRYENAGKRVNRAFFQAVMDYLFQFNGLGVKYGIGELWTEQEALNRIRWLSHHNPSERLHRLKAVISRQDREAERTLRVLDGGDDLRRFVNIVRTYIYLRIYRADILSTAFANAFPLFDEIAKRTGVERKTILECLPGEALSFKIPAPEFVARRAKTVLVHGRNSRVYYLFGQPAKAIYFRLRRLKGSGNQPATPRRDNIISGTIANSGIVRGIARVVRDNSELGKVQEGDTLVAVMTTPDFVPAMERAAAFVTDEGGILCHAAIVSREMNKPCVVGTKIATKVLRDGDLVEVDAEKGTVRKIK